MGCIKYLQSVQFICLKWFIVWCIVCSFRAVKSLSLTLKYMSEFDGLTALWFQLPLLQFNILGGIHLLSFWPSVRREDWYLSHLLEVLIFSCILARIQISVFPLSEVLTYFSFLEIPDWSHQMLFSPQVLIVSYCIVVFVYLPFAISF